MSILTPEEEAKFHSAILNLVLSKCKKIKDNRDYFTDEIIDIAISEVEQYILDFCRIPFIKREIHYIWADMVIDVLLGRYAEDVGGGSASSSKSGATKKIKIGDTTIEKDVSNTTSPTGHELNLDDTLKGYKQRLYLYRRIW